MARNEEKHYGRLNRLYLLKEKEEYEKAHPKRPRLDSLDTVEEIQKWLPSIKKDLDFYLKKSQVICYSDAHVEECKEKVVGLEKEFKAFVRKIKRLSPSPQDVIPWTSRPYKRKNPTSSPEETSNKEFKRIATPILEKENPQSPERIVFCNVDWDLMNQPLSFSNSSNKDEKESLLPKNLQNSDPSQSILAETKNYQVESNDQPKNCFNIVNYDSSDSEDS